MTSAVAISVAVSRAEDVVFPRDMGIVDVRDYGAVGDGVADDTAAIQAALEAKPTRNTPVYLPNGKYRIVRPLRFPKGEWLYSGNILQGQSQDRTVIVLADRAEGFADPAKPQAMIDGGGYGRTSNAFHNYIRDLTVDTGKGNPGAIGVRFYSNNTGAVREVMIRSGDGTGKVGLDLGYLPDNGPLLVKNVRIEGFDEGVRTDGGVNSQTFESLTLADQNVLGFRNTGQGIFIRGLRSKNRVTAFSNEGISHAVIVDAKLEGGDPATPAIVNSGDVPKMLLRNVECSGYGELVRNKTAGGLAAAANVPPPRIDEWLSFGPPVGPLVAFDSRPKTLNLPIVETPLVPRDATENWINAADYGAKPTDGKDDTEALQAAIDSTLPGGKNDGKTTLYLPAGASRGYPEVPNGYHLKTLRVRGSIRRIVGGESGFTGLPNYWDPSPIYIEEGTHPVVEFDRMTNLQLHNTSSRTVVVRSSSGDYVGAGKGGAFLEDFVGRLQIRDGHTVYARQLNPEGLSSGKYDRANVINDGATLSVLGLKTEGGSTIVENRNGATTEILGGFFYTTRQNPTKAPMILNADSRLSLSVSEASFIGKQYETYVRTVRGNQTQDIRRSDLKLYHYGDGMSLLLYSGTLGR